jgi:branched-chain amino acid transport system substrate-binding protein
MAWLLSAGDVVGGPKPIKVGLSMALTGAIAVNGKQLLAALEIWRDDVNARGGLLGRPVELVYYDDQSNPANVPSIYTKLISLDKVNLLIGPYATNMIAAAIPVIAPYNMMTLGIFGLEVNRQFHYPKYFSMLPTGQRACLAFRSASLISLNGRTQYPRRWRSRPPMQSLRAPQRTVRA